MSGSPFYQRIKGDVLTICRLIPVGRVTSFADIGRHLDVVPRHIAYILSQLASLERETVPWHRVVAANGTASSAAQLSLLNDENVALEGNQVPADSPAWINLTDLSDMIPPQQRPANAPITKSRRRQS
jgi:methylated-DNA-protein-cysteine methyltransferase related protein